MLSRKWSVGALSRRLQIAYLRNRDRLRFFLRLLPNEVHQELTAKYRGQNISPSTNYEEICRQYRTLANGALLDFLHTSESFSFPHSNSPVLSVILVTYGQAGLTFRCLQSLKSALPKDSEVIIVDNASTDETYQLLDRCNGIKVKRLITNIGFLQGANLGAGMSTGKYLLFLNNDTLLQKTAIFAALERFQTETRLGVVGAKLVHFDRTIQEIGGIVFPDGRCKALFRNFRSEGSNFPNLEIDYCSGAFLMTPRSLFQQLGGFHFVYSPAYYEDVDYCIRVSEAGYRIVCEQEACIYHLEYGSAQSSHDAIREMEKNRAIFSKKHSSFLAKKEKDALHPNKDIIILLENHLPNPARGCGYPRLQSILHSLERSGYKCILGITRPSDQLDNQKRNLQHQFPYYHICHQTDLFNLIEEVRQNLKCIIASRPNNLAFLKAFLKKHRKRLGKIPVIYDSEALFCLRDSRAKQLLKKRVIPTWHPQTELDLSLGCEQVWAISEEERQFFKKGGIENVELITDALSQTHDMQSSHFSEREGFLFVGSAHSYPTPNADALLWFLSSVYPLIRSLMSQPPTVTVVGNVKAEELFGLDQNGVHFIGTIERVDDYYQSKRIFIAPTRYASGIPRKCIDAAANGLPIVCTSLLANSLQWTDGVEVLAADYSSPTDFAAKCVELYTNEVLWQEIRKNAFERVSAQFSEDKFDRSIADALMKI